ncbi:hypothetical protein QMK33_00540 [Hymenobacter sp. H14-R3]|uniref:hypothetical protein n=1 Tax=Hymenobacter sp. H14-R3 TaxID=3046308 RepID=UPI0024BBA407|nr:hypothetical protein [Hymenobacter sp. H14-R3]MDJ0363622.1 hypothetical protein [Hymenobacter sp. H14-R3]
MKPSYASRRGAASCGASTATCATLAAGRDFTTLDGQVVPRALGELALRQRTAMLVGGLLIGEWPEII